MSRAGSARLALRAALGTTVSAVAVVLILQTVNLNEVRDALGAAQWSGILGVTVLLGADVVLRAIRWRALLRPLAPVDLRRTLAHQLIGYLANNALPARLGEVVRSYSLGDRQGISRASVGGTVIVERVMDVGALAVMSSGALFLVPAGVFVSVTILTAVGVSVAAGGVLWWITSARHTGAAGRSHGRWVDWFIGLVRRLHAGLSVVRSRRAVTTGVVASAAAWLLTGVAFTFAGASVGLSLSPAQVMLFVAGINLATAIPAGPAYVGTYELAAVTVAAAVGVPAPQALAMAVLVHVATVALTSAGGLLSLAWEYLRPDSSLRRIPAAVPADDPEF